MPRPARAPKRFRGIPGLRYEEDGPVARFTLSRPDRLNALTFEMYEALRDAFGSFRRRKDLRVIILTGEGRAFCSGGDVEDIIGHLVKMDRAGLQRFTKLTCDVIANMRSCPQPIIAALNGTVAGAGAALAVASDFRIAVPEAKIAFLFVKAGLSGADMGAAYLLPRLVGLGRATEYLMLGEFVPAAEALRVGLYHGVVAPDRLLPEAEHLAKRLAEGPSEAIRVTKQTVDRQVRGSLGEALAWDARVQAACMRHPDFREAYEAFRAKRTAKFA